MRNIFKAALVAGVAVIAATSAAHATIVPLSGDLTIWSADTPGSSYTSPNQAGSAANPLAQTTALFSGIYTGPLDFVDPLGGSDTIGGFLATSPAFSVSGDTSGFGTEISAYPFQHVSLFDFSFTLTSAADINITHDDGISIWDSSNTTDLVDSSGPTTADGTSFSLGAGSYNLWYAEANGLPADLVFDAPEPVSLSLLGAGLVGVGLARARRRRASSATAAA